jgi:hypothetical protein
MTEVYLSQQAIDCLRSGSLADGRRDHTPAASGSATSRVHPASLELVEAPAPPRDLPPPSRRGRARAGTRSCTTWEQPPSGPGFSLKPVEVGAPP